VRDEVPGAHQPGVADVPHLDQPHAAQHVLRRRRTTQSLGEHHRIVDETAHEGRRP
jgi:hypothetical protein